MRILFITLGVPYPPDSGPRIRDYHLIRAVAADHAVLVLSLDSSPDDRAVLELRKWCEVVEVVPDTPRSVSEHLASVARGLLAGRPLAMHPFYRPEMAAAIRRILRQRAVDVVQIEHSFLAGYVMDVPQNLRCRTVLSFHNLGVRQYRRMLHTRLSLLGRIQFGMKWIAMLGWEPHFARRFDHSIMVSELERKLLHERDATLAVTVIENGVDTGVRRPIEATRGRHALLFVGTLGYPPNADAVIYFVESILPLVRREVPDVTFTVVGGPVPPRVRRLSDGERVRIVGRVPEVVPYYAASDVSVVPLRAGGGTRLKILESMALGRPVVSTSLGCEGLQVVDGEHLLIADDPQTFACKVVELLQAPPLRERIARQARARAEEVDWKNIGRKLTDLYEELCPEPAEPMLGAQSGCFGETNVA